MDIPQKKYNFFVKNIGVQNSCGAKSIISNIAQ